jgi:FAD/FMN-containing dehydrogenase
VQEKAGDSVTSFEMIPANAVEMVAADIPSTRDPLPSNAAWRVLIEISQPSAGHARALMESALEAAAEAGLIQDGVIAASEAQAKSFWHIRESIPLSKRAYGSALNQDISVPVSRIPAFIEACNAAVRSILPQADFVIFGHVGDGNLHYSVVESAGAAAPQLKAAEAAITRTIFDTVMAHGGSISAEHGVGRLKRDELARLRPPAATETMRAIKRALDPLNIMNPDRVVSV